MSLKTLIKQRASIKSSLKSLLTKIQAEDRTLSAEEQTEVQALKTDLEGVNQQIEIVEQAEALIGDDEPETNQNQARSRIATAGTQSANNGIPGPRAKEKFDSLDDFMATAMSNPNDSRLVYVTRSEPSNIQEMRTGVSGGFAVPTEFRPLLFVTNMAQALVRPRALIIPAGSSPDAEVVIPSIDDQPEADANKIFGGVVISKVAEGGTKPVTGMDLRGRSLKPHEFAARIPFTDKLLRNWQAASGWAAQLLGGAMRSFEDFQFTLGDGIGGPEGAIDAASTYEVPRTTSNTIVLEDIQEMLARFRGDLSKAVWGVSYSAFSQLLAMVGQGGGATNVISVNQATGSMSIYGVPVMRHSRLRALGSKGDIGLYDFSEYLIKDGSGPLIETGYATGQWEANQSSIKITFNVDGKAWRTKIFRNEEDYECSSIVVLGLPSGS